MPHGTRPILSMRRARCSAFTMVELLAATALMSLLMLAVLQVTTSLGRARTLMQAQQGLAVWQLDVAAQLERDLAQAGHVQLDAEGALRLEGPLAIELGDRGADHLPAIVHYRLVEAGEQKLLVREQREVLDRTARDRGRQLVAMHVEQFDVELTQASRGKPAEDEDPLLAVRVVVHFADSRHPPVTVRVARGTAQEQEQEK